MNPTLPLLPERPMAHMMSPKLTSELPDSSLPSMNNYSPLRSMPHFIKVKQDRIALMELAVL